MTTHPNPQADASQESRSLLHNNKITEIREQTLLTGEHISAIMQRIIWTPPEGFHLIVVVRN